MEGLSGVIDGETVFSDIYINLSKGDKVVLYSKDSRATSLFYDIVNNNTKANSGKFSWGVTTSQSYLPLDNSSFFHNKLSLVDWLRQWATTEEEREEVYVVDF